ncbi:SpoIIE family protein phosphatase [Streptomyces sp. TRM 70351]|uniref:SpoIIE family protein phosphatase n=1 Tax=Streptomyces sp. TRM 70351 TaxID=3116552 RepID=UPI002E7ADE72|nr:SpoIIE family protein phosphatase [Streptomyces sp. TRM 70351]MEE1930336.1 SpoIIE family protein phosphatase [Streptomyces sp. TRM 70351]
MADADESGRERVAAEALAQSPLMFLALEGPELRVALVNAAARAQLGGGRALEGVPVREAVPEAAGQQLSEMAEHIYATGEPAFGREWRMFLDADGDGAPTEFYNDFTGVRWRYPDDSPRGVILVGRDVTDGVRARRERRAEAALRARPVPVAAEAVREFQRALLPDRLPVLPGLEVAACYLAAGGGHEAGGDWFDALVREDGGLALVVGDVVGHGVRAAAVMSRLRTVLAERLTGGEDLPAALAGTGRLAVRTPRAPGRPDAYGATVCAALVDPSTGAVRYSTCGHPPPLVLRADGSAAYLSPSGDGPLGTGGEPRTATAALGPGDALLLFSNGLVERPHRPWRDRLGLLATVARDAVAGRGFLRAPQETAAAHVARVVVDVLTRDGCPDDVTALLVRRRAGPPPALAVRLSGGRGGLARVRDGVDAWAREAGADQEDRYALTLAVSEAVTNSVEHGYGGGGAPPGPPRVVVDGVIGADGTARLTVTDEGRWRDPPTDPGYRGRGLAMAGDALEELVVEPGAHGTRVRFARRLGRPPVLGLALDPVAGGAGWPGPGGTGGGSGQPAGAAFSAWLEPGPEAGAGAGAHAEADADARSAAQAAGSADGPVVRVSGPVDAGDADRLASLLGRAGRAGLVPLTVDLCGVTHLGSSAVRVLHAASAVRLRAVPGGSTAFVLDLVGLPWDPPAAGRER